MNLLPHRAIEHMFRALIPLLADKYHVIAPDHLGFGLSDAPTVDEFDYSFDALTQITAIISQNGNAYDEGFVEAFWEDVWAYAADQNEQTESAMRFALTREAIRWQYLHGVPDPSPVDPETWEHDLALVSRPGNDLVQLQLFRDYVTNPPLYPQVHEYLESHLDDVATRIHDFLATAIGR